MLRILVDPAPIWRDATKGQKSATPYHVQTARGVTLASFKTRQMAESYMKSALLKIAMDLDSMAIARRIAERNQSEEERRIGNEEETLP